MTNRLPFEREWQEVPQALFLSWSEARQLAYCAARDEAPQASYHPSQQFYQERAAAYREDLEEALYLKENDL